MIGRKLYARKSAVAISRAAFALLVMLVVGIGMGQGVLRVGSALVPHNLDPTFDTHAFSQTVFRTMYEGLVAIDSSGREVPLLAESWEVVDDTTWEFHLRRGVRFHNGVEFTAEDVEFTLNRVLDVETNAPWRTRVNLVEAVEVVDPYTVRIRTASPFATLLKGLAIVYILPSSEYDENDSGRFLQVPVGTGPFEFVGGTAGQVVEVARNTEYWGQTPLIDGIVYRAIPEPSSRIAGLRAGELDLIYEVPSEAVSQLESQGFAVEEVSLGQAFSLGLAAARGGPLDDRRVRQAINHAIDVDLIIETIMQGYGTRLQGQTVGPDGLGYNPDVRAYEYNPDRARELLAEAGYADGLTLVFESTVDYYIKDSEISQAIVAMLADVGITVDLVILDQTTRQAHLFDGTLGPLFLISWQYMPAMDAEQPLVFLASTAAQKLMNDARVDELLARVRSTLDPDARLEALHELIAHVREEAPMVYMWQVPLLVASSTNVVDLNLFATWGFDLFSVNLQP